jgi:predicted TIM-barrel enzyme
MTKAGADILVAHMGLTSDGTIGARTTKSLDDCVRQVQAIIDTSKALRPDVLVLCHGGPIATPKQAQYLLQECRGLDGFYGASSMERLPTEIAITSEVREFGALRLNRKSHAST